MNKKEIPQEVRDYFSQKGKKGVKARNKMYSPEQRKEWAIKGGKARAKQKRLAAKKTK